MKRTFASKTFASKTFACGTWTGVGVPVATDFPTIMLTGDAQRNVGVGGMAQRSVTGTGHVQRSVSATGDRGSNAI